MKKIVVALGLFLLTTGLLAQTDEGAKVVTSSQAIQSNGFHIQVGVPFLGQNKNTTDRIIEPVDIRFPWDVLYLFTTFSYESFNVSKGFFGDKIRIDWELKANINLISSIKIYKRIYNEANPNANDFEFVGSVAPSVTVFEDEYVEGGVLYEYKVVGVGISEIESIFNTYITGIGYRNPTAVVTGNVSYQGGNPVKDVIVKASSEGSSGILGNSLKVPSQGTLKIEDLSSPITTATTFQAWLKPESPFTNDTGAPIQLVQYSQVNDVTLLNVTVNLLATSNKLSVNIGGSEYQLENYYPSGRVNTRGDDIMLPVAAFNDNFVHFSVVIEDAKVPKLYINGREISTAYKEEVNLKLTEVDPNYTAPYFEVNIPIQTNTLSPGEWNDVFVGGNQAAFVDEIRVWKSTLSAQKIRTDYSRYISGNDSRLVSYIRANEGTGSFAYDLSRNGFNYNKNHGNFGVSIEPLKRILWTSGAGNFPTSDQLGILGVTDINGNYEISAIPYSGTGESFNITPLYGLHQFEPAQQLVFLGEGSEVVNKIDFIDKSSFSFKGKVLFDTRKVFTTTDPIATDPPEIQDIIEEPCYNCYQTVGKGKLDNGEYWVNDNGTPNDASDDVLEHYAKIYLEGANVYIDGNIVIDENSSPVVTDKNGFFDISVPIGNHFISVRKEGHNFKYGGRFPAETGTTKEFFEDSNEPVVFIDSTRVTLIGKVVGGSVQAAKVTGFGSDGLFQRVITNEDGSLETLTISSKNNIGKTNIKLAYGTSGPETEFNLTTNSETGEYRVNVMPLEYQINQEGGIVVESNKDIKFLKGNETVDLSIVEDLIRPTYEFADGTFEYGEPYHYERSFTYRSTPVLRVTSQTSESTLNIDGKNISTDGFQYPIYNQFGNYEIRLRSFESYVNNDVLPSVEDIVPVIDGEFLPTNNLALTGSEAVQRSPTDQSTIIYTFKGGLPTVSSPYIRTINLRFRIGGKDYEVEDYINEGIVLGGQSDGSKTFTVEAPDVPDIILRDPPGSNSFASIQSGESISFTVDNQVSNSGGVTQGIKVMNGVEFAAGGGIIGPAIKTEVINNVTGELSVKTGSTDGESLTKTYTFNQTISTSDSPDFVGAEGDLYIGQSKNYFYGSYDDVLASSGQIAGSQSFILTNSAGEDVYIGKKKALYFSEQPSETFFILSQKYILETAIPDLETIIENYDSQTKKPPLTKEQYVQQVSLWRKVILGNELTKYRALKDREAYKAETLSTIDGYIAELETEIGATSVGVGYQNTLFNNLDEGKKLKAIVEPYFEENISFDAGVGEFSRSVETIIVNNKSTNFNTSIDESLQATLGFGLGGIGVVSTTKGFINQNKNSTLSEEETKTTVISYTLKDSDASNALSVDIVNAFDGNGPIFSTIGGRTSCPHEGPELSYFYNHLSYNPDSNSIPVLAEAKREELSFGTQKTEDPKISVAIADQANIPESKKAEFTLILENNADVNGISGPFSYFDLSIDNLSNPYNIITNLPADGKGTLVNVPYGEKVEFTLTMEKSISDRYLYENIKVVLASRCDGAISSEILLSASFVPSCSQVEVSAPLDNWVYNNRSAFNTDGSTNPLEIKLNEFDLSFNSFKKIDLEYRLATSSTWTRLKTFYTTQAFYDEALSANETEIMLIDAAELSYQFNIAEANLADGEYELRARSTCTNDTEFISDIVKGTVDLTSPQRFGTPLPIDGILGAGEDLRASFNEPIFFNSAISTIEIKGQTNQLPVDNNVSLYFDGADKTAVINNPKITTGDLTIEFWMKNSTEASNANIIKQDGGLNIGIVNNEIFITLGGITAKGLMASDGLFHHYTFTFNNATSELSIYEDDAEVDASSSTANIEFTNNTALIIGGNTFIGNMHSLRLWTKSITLENAYARMYDDLIGNEANLIGYWPMDEGKGVLANDLARFKHAVVNVDWDIKPKGNSYEFLNGQYLTLDDVNLVQLTIEMDATISFWIKTANGQEATLFSNGRGDGTDLVQPNGLTNKWAINMTNGGQLTFESEGTSYSLTTESVADDNWHHITILLNRIGSVRAYVDAKLVSSNPIASIGGFSGNKIWLGARGSKDLAGVESVDNFFSGKLDELRLWNTLRNVEQIDRDRFNEVDVESIGLMLYAKMNAPEPQDGSGPLYFHSAVNESISGSLAVINSGGVNYSGDVPAIKPARELIKFKVNHVINGDEIILEPVVTDWAALEGQILDITIEKMYDKVDNRQQSPITWTTFVRRNEVSWFAEGYNEIVDIIKNSAEEKSFEITLINKGGKVQPFTITNIPNWLKLSTTSSTLQPVSKLTITAKIEKNLSPGDYLENLYLQTDFGYDEKLQIELKVLEKEPNWTVDPNNFEYSLNIVGKVKIDGEFTEDSFDKIAAFINDEVRGSTYVTFDDAYQEYIVYLTVYSNTVFGEEISFNIWDASRGKILEASVDGTSSITFEQNNVLGTLANSVIFENTNAVYQEIGLIDGWSWISLNVNDPMFADLDSLTQNLTLQTDDRILSHSPAQLETYYVNESNPANNGWSGSIGANGGLKVSNMYKFKSSQAQAFVIKGTPVDISTWSFPIKKDWNWLPYPLSGNQPTNDALAYFDALEGDVIKSQNLFAIYDPILGWKGTLNYLNSGEGYMIKSSKDQQFLYPNYLNGRISFGRATISEDEEGTISKFSKYRENMNAVVSLPAGYSKLFVYDSKGVLKGKALNQQVSGVELSFITIYGEAPEQLTFFIGNGDILKETSYRTLFNANTVLGSISEPIVLENITTTRKVFPNPFIKDLTVRIEVLESEIVHVQLYSLTNQLVFSQDISVDKGESFIKITPNISSGLYLLKVNSTGNTILEKVIKQ